MYDIGEYACKVRFPPTQNQFKNKQSEPNTTCDLSKESCDVENVHFVMNYLIYLLF